jgi:DNA mismatch endonuclease, patch repair protein
MKRVDEQGQLCFKKYIRDGRAPIPKNERTSRVMSSIKGKNTSPELSIRKAISTYGLKGYRLHLKKVPGRPDIAFTKKKLAIFINGCYWHRCPYCSPSFPKTHRKFWKEKFKKNIERDKKKNKELKALGWSVLTLWECQIKNNISSCVKKIKRKL